MTILLLSPMLSSEECSDRLTLKHKNRKVVVERFLVGKERRARPAAQILRAVGDTPVVAGGSVFLLSQ